MRRPDQSQASPQRTSLRLVNRPIAITALACALFVAAPTVLPVAADPTDSPTSSTMNAADLAALDGAIAQLERDQASAYQAVLIAGEAYSVALAEYGDATRFAEEASEKAQQAQDRAKESRRFVAKIARDSARGSTALDALGAFFVADGLNQLVSETEALAKVNEKTDIKFQQYKADKLVADVLARKAQEASEQALAKREEANAALAQAELLEQQAEESTAQALAQRNALVEQAAAARRTTIAQEERRQEELAQQRADAERQAAEDRIDRQEEAAANDTVVVDEVPREDPSPSRTSPEPEESTDEPEEPTEQETSASPTPTRTSASPSPTRTTASPTPTPTRTSASPSPTRTTASPSPSPTRTTSSPSPTPTRTSTPKPTATTPKPSSDPNGLGKGVSYGSAAKGKAAVAEAKKHLGKPYGYGSAGPNAFDCSGLTSVAWSNAGVSITRTSRSQYQRVLKIKLSDMRPGDLVFWGSNPKANDANSVYHVGMYIGGGQMIEASRPGVPVKISAVRYDANLMPFAGRP